uniref:Hypoxia up-regulated protein 1 n=1 Tax=Culicoides sonorensis TaxID=179676 RepID=A0A336MZ63_CULSO
MSKNISIALDIGSTKIVAAYCNENGQAFIITDPQTNRWTIACIGFSNRQRLYGFAAECQASTNPKNTIFGEGGSTFTHKLTKYFIDEFRNETSINLTNNEVAIARLREGCETLKKKLSTSESAKVTLETFYEGKPYELIMTRQIFELTCADIFHKIITVGRRLFQSTFIQKSSIHATIIIGGGTRIPKIQQDLKSFMHGEELSRVLNQDEAIAIGAAYYNAGLIDVEEPPKPNSLFGECSGLDIAKMQLLLKRMDEDETLLVEYMSQVNDLEKLCYSYKRAIIKHNVDVEDENLVVRKCNEILKHLEKNENSKFDRNDFRRMSKELKEVYSAACNRKIESTKEESNSPPKVETNVILPPKQSVVIREEKSGQELFDQGVALFVSENYKDALEIFSYFIQITGKSINITNITIHDLYSYRAQCYFHMRKYEKFFDDFDKIPKDKRSTDLKKFSEKAYVELFMTRGNNALKDVHKRFKGDAEHVNIALSVLNSVLDTRPSDIKSLEQLRLTSNLLHTRSILHFQLRNDDQAIVDSYKNMKLIHEVRDLNEERDKMYWELGPYLKTIKIDQLRAKYGQTSVEQMIYIKSCIKQSQKMKKVGKFYCC